MATDATGTPTSPDSIPTFNTSVDAPSGLGTNAQMAAIQTALNTRPATPASIASGEAMIWNGSTFVRSSVLGLSPSGISGYPADATKVLKGDGTWATISSTSFRKITSAQVINTTTETDLFNSEFTIPANTIGTNKQLRITAVGDGSWGNSFQGAPQFKLKLGATTLIDTGVQVNDAAHVRFTTGLSGRAPWRMDATISGANATNAQVVRFYLDMVGPAATLNNGGPTAFAVGNGQVGSMSISAVAQPMYYGINNTTVDTTASQTLTFTVTHTNASTLTDIKLFEALVEVV